MGAKKKTSVSLSNSQCLIFDVAEQSCIVPRTFPGQQAFVHKDTKTHSLKTEASPTAPEICLVPHEADGKGPG